MKSRKLRVLLTGGGSGGHVSPLLAIAEAIRQEEEGVRFLYVGVRHGLESEIVPRAGIPLKFTASMGFPSTRNPFVLLRFSLVIAWGLLRAVVLLLGYRPDAIVASGGYASAPTVFAASMLRLLSFGFFDIPIYMHEQNAVPGRMNLLASRFATCIGVSHAAAQRRLHGHQVELVGYPIRPSFASIDRETARRQLGLADEDIYLLVTGGSQGARTINRGLVEALPKLAVLPNLHIIHASGNAKKHGYNAYADTQGRVQALDRVPEHYRLEPFLHDIPLHLAAADLALIRAGAGSLVEVCSAGVPALVIPKANLPGDSQVANAREMAAQELVELMFEEPQLTEEGLIEVVSGDALAKRLLQLIEDKPRRDELARRATVHIDRQGAHRVARRVLQLARRVAPIEEEQPHQTTQGDAPPLLRPSSPTMQRRRVETSLGFAFERAYDHGPVRSEELARLEDLAYLRYRGAALLAHRSWRSRNEGVKLLGLTGHREKRGLLCSLLEDRTPAPRLQRLLGGDFQQVGFIRRNIVTTLALLGPPDETVSRALLSALEDPYYEVRSHALHLMRRFLDDGWKAPEGTGERVRRLTRDRRLEVRWEAIHCFGYLGEPREVLEICRQHGLATSTPIREAVLRAYHALLDRIDRQGGSGVLRAELEEDLERFGITSVAFHPYFPLKDQYSALRRRTREGKEV